MDKNLLNISKIETFFNTLLINKVSANIFFGNVPITIDSKWKDFIVVDTSSTIRDMEAYGRGVVSILLYSAKNRVDGSKNTAVLGTLEKKLNDIINASNDEHYIISRLSTMSEYDITNKLYFNVVFINLSIY